MIAAALQHLTRELNASLRRGLALDADIAVLSHLVGPDGAPVPQAQEKLALFLVNVLRDTAAVRAPTQRGGLSRLAQGQPPVHLNLMLMVAANFGGSNYGESLKLIAHAVAFFQSRPVFDQQNSPEMDRRIERLVVELEDLPTTDLSNLWGILGGHYLPSVLYRVRLLSIDAGLVNEQLPLVLRAGTSTEPA